jgi:transcriptional regulator with XRE-family HTH domain
MVTNEEKLQAQRAMVRRMLEHVGLDATGLARKAAISPSTLTRFLNNDRRASPLSPSTLIKLAEVTGFPFSIKNPLSALQIDLPAPGAATDHKSPVYIVEHVDQVRLLTLWDLLTTAEKTALLRYLKQLVLTKRTDPP